MARQAKHLKELHGLTVYIRKSDLRATLLRNVNDSEEDRDTDAVDQLRITEVDHQRAATTVQLPATFMLNFFTG
jgi:hypothetical protein